MAASPGLNGQYSKTTFDQASGTGAPNPNTPSPGITSCVPPSKAASFEYSPLDKQRKQIRLFRLLASEPEVVLDLQIFDLESAPSFAAISYRWGSTASPGLVLVNGKELSVGRNLHDLLRGHFETLVTTHLWADQICIAQETIDEKNHQVRLMEEIYRGAEQVVVWLGMSQESSDVVSAVKNLGPLRRFRTRLSKERIGHLDTIELGAMRTLVGNAYWERHWIVQELCFSQRLCFLYGTHQIPLENIETLVEFVRCDEQARNDSLDKLGTLLEPNSQPGMTIRDDNQWADAMRICSETRCQDPRDKIFGIQSIFRIDECRIEVDYAKSAECIFKEFAILAFEHVDTWFVCRGLACLAIGMGFRTWADFKRPVTVEDLDEALTIFLNEIGKDTSPQRQTKEERQMVLSDPMAREVCLELLSMFFLTEGHGDFMKILQKMRDRRRGRLRSGAYSALGWDIRRLNPRYW